MRIYIFLGILLWITNDAQAQDTLYKADGSAHFVEVLEINETQVKYKLHASLEGPIYFIGVEHVVRIVHEDGFIQVFPKPVSDSLAMLRWLDPRITDFGRNFISVNLFDLFQGNLTIGYEYTFKSGLSSLKVPISYKVANIGYSYEPKVFGIGLDYYLYPSGQGQSKFFCGPSFEYKKFGSTYSNFKGISTHSLLFQFGVLFQLSKHFNISLNGGLGYTRIIGTDFYGLSNYGEVATKAGLNIGFKF